MDNTKKNTNTSDMPKKAFNWILILAILIVVTSTFLTWYSGGMARIGGAWDDTLFDVGSGYLFIILSVPNLLFALLRKRLPTYIITALIATLAGIQINATISELPYWAGSRFGVGFYLMITGIILMIASHFIFNALLKRKESGVRNG